PAIAVLVTCAVEVASTVTPATGDPSDPSVEPSTSARTVFVIVDRTTAAPIEAPPPLPWPPFAIWIESAPAVPLVWESSLAVTLTAPEVVIGLPTIDATVLLAIVLRTPAPAPEKPAVTPLWPLVYEPALPAATEVIVAVLDAETETGPAAMIGDGSIVAAVMSPMSLMATAMPIVTLWPEPLLVTSTVTATPPAFASIVAESVALTLTPPEVVVTGLFAISASIVLWTVLLEPAPAPLNAKAPWLCPPCPLPALRDVGRAGEGES